jgi:hypothetical protein
MTGKATLQAKPGPSPGSVTLILDCPHGTTRGLVINDQPDLRQAIVDQIVGRHLIEEGCNCVASLRPTSAEARA